MSIVYLKKTKWRNDIISKTTFSIREENVKYGGRILAAGHHEGGESNIKLKSKEDKNRKNDKNDQNSYLRENSVHNIDCNPRMLLKDIITNVIVEPIFVISQNIWKLDDQIKLPLEQSLNEFKSKVKSVSSTILKIKEQVLSSMDQSDLVNAKNHFKNVKFKEFGENSSLKLFLETFEGDWKSKLHANLILDAISIDSVFDQVEEFFDLERKVVCLQEKFGFECRNNILLHLAPQEYPTVCNSCWFTIVNENTLHTALCDMRKSLIDVENNPNSDDDDDADSEESREDLFNDSLTEIKKNKRKADMDFKASAGHLISLIRTNMSGILMMVIGLVYNLLDNSEQSIKEAKEICETIDNDIPLAPCKKAILSKILSEELDVITNSKKILRSYLQSNFGMHLVEEELSELSNRTMLYDNFKEVNELFKKVCRDVFTMVWLSRILEIVDLVIIDNTNKRIEEEEARERQEQRRQREEENEEEDQEERTRPLNNRSRENNDECNTDDLKCLYYKMNSTFNSVRLHELNARIAQQFIVYCKLEGMKIRSSSNILLMIKEKLVKLAKFFNQSQKEMELMEKEILNLLFLFIISSIRLYEK